MIRHRMQLDLEWIQDVFVEIAGSLRTDLVHRFLPRLEAEIQSTVTQLHAIELAFRRAVASIEDTLLDSEALPVLRPGLQVKYVAAQSAHLLTMFLDFAIGYVISVQGFHLAPLWAIGVAFLFAGLAVLSRAVASLWLDRNRPGQHIRLFLRIGLAGWALVVLSFIGFYAVRNALVGVQWLAVLTPVLWLACLVQSLAFGVLAEVFGFPATLVRQHRALTARLGELEAVRALMQGGNSDDEEDSSSTVRLRPSPTPRGGSKRGGSRGRASRGAARLGGLVALLLLLNGSTHPALAESSSITRLVIALDDSPGLEDTKEFLRVRRALGEGLGELTRALPDLQSVQVLHWSDAATVWAAGRTFPLPRHIRSTPLEAGLAPFAQALSFQREADAAHNHTLQAPVLESVFHEMLALPDRPAAQSCVTQLALRAMEAPASQCWIIVSDLKDYRCAGPAAYLPGGAVLRVIAIPQMEGASMRQRLGERIEQLLGRFPGIVVVPSWDIDDPLSVRSLIAPAGGRVEVGSP